MSKKRIAQTAPPPGFIDLGSGNPGLDLIPLDALQDAANKYFRAGDPRTLQYGAEQGNGYFLEALADFLTSQNGFQVQPEYLFTTTGASSALDLLCTLKTNPGDVVFVEEPSYFLALRIFEDHNLEVESIPMDEQGMDVDWLEDKLKDHQPKFVYTIPSFQNPSGLTLSQERRKKLMDLAQQHSFLIVADEVYQFLSYTKKPPSPFAAYTHQVDQIVSINSFSKILAPGLRLGWIQAHPSLINRLTGCGLLDSGGGLNPFTSALIYYLIDAGDLDHNIQRLKETYQERINAMAKALDRYLPLASYRKPHGGFFFWPQVSGISTADVRKRVKSFQVDYRPGVLFSSTNSQQDYMRLGISYYGPDEIEQGIKSLGECFYPE